MDSLACNAVLLPSDALASAAITTSHQLASKGVLFTLADGSFYPHLSLYMLQLRGQDLTQAAELLANIAKDRSSLILRAQRYDQAKQFVDAEYDRTTELSKLQNKVVAALNPIRDGMRAKDAERMKDATGLALENYKAYGWNTIGELYRPHVTLTRFAEDQTLDGLPLPGIAEFSGDFVKLGLFEMGDNGTCVRKIAEFDLSPIQ